MERQRDTQGSSKENMNYLHCKKHPNQILWASENGTVCCVCLHEEHPLSEALRNSPPAGHYLGSPEEIAARNHAEKYPQCDTCGIHYSAEKGHDGCKGSDWKKFHTADWYTCDDTAESLTHECWDEAIAEHIDGWYDPAPPPNKPIDEVIEIVSPLTVYAYKKKVLDRSFAESMVDKFIEELQDADCMAESWWEEYGDIDGDHPPIAREGEEVKALASKLTDILHEHMLEHSHVWQCDVIAEKEFEEGELTAILKDHSPHWWEE